MNASAPQESLTVDLKDHLTAKRSATKLNKTLFPPYRYGITEDGLYHGAYPRHSNLPFLSTLKLHSILSLTPEPLILPVPSVNLVHFRVDKPKDNIPLTYGKMSAILAILIDSSLHPLYVHCLDGTLITGLVICCLRKLQCWTIPSILSEYSRGTPCSQEQEFLEKFQCDLEIDAASTPPWLFPIPIRKHPTFLRLRFLSSMTQIDASAVQQTPIDSGEWVSRISDSQTASSATTPDIAAFTTIPFTLSTTPSTLPLLPPPAQSTILGSMSVMKDELRRQQQDFYVTRHASVVGDGSGGSGDVEEMSLTLQALALEFGRK